MFNVVRFVYGGDGHTGRWAIVMLVRVTIPPNTPADWEERWADEYWSPAGHQHEVPWDGRTLGATVDLRASIFLESLRRNLKQAKYKDSCFRNKLKLAFWIDQHVSTDQEVIELPTTFNFERDSDYYLEGVICTEGGLSSLHDFEAVTCSTCSTCETRFNTDSLSKLEYDTIGIYCYVLLCPANHHLFVAYSGVVTGA